MRDTGFIVFDPEETSWDAARCTDEADLRLCLANRFEHIHPTILAFEVDGRCHDVTEDYRPAPVEETPTREIGWRRSHTEYMAQLGSFDR